MSKQPSAVGSCARLLQHHNEVGMPPPPPAAVLCIQTNAPPCRLDLQVLCAGDPETIKYSMRWWARCGPCMQPHVPAWQCPATQPPLPLPLLRHHAAAGLAHAPGPGLACQLLLPVLPLELCCCCNGVAAVSDAPCSAVVPPVPRCQLPQKCPSTASGPMHLCGPCCAGPAMLLEMCQLAP